MDYLRAGPNKRVCAFFIDCLLGQIVGFVLSSAFSRDVSWVSWAAVILFRDCLNGQSLGKYLVGTQVVDENNAPARPGKAVLRNITMVISIVPLIEYVVMLCEKEEGKRLGDRLARTRVRDLKPQLSDMTFLWLSIALALILAIIKYGLISTAYILQTPAASNG